MSPCSGPVDVADIAAWLRLLETPRLGRASIRQLLAAFGSPQGVLEAPTGALADIVGPARARLLAAPPPGLDRLVDATLAWLAAPGPRHLLPLGDPRYPAALLESPDPPLLLHLHGAPDRLAAGSIAIVGSRHPTPQGADHAQAFARALSRAGWCVVSGLATGIDAAAHRGALDGAGGTVAVVGTGLDTVYPRRHGDLAREIVAAGGAVVSEYTLGTPPLAENFPRRNRLIAGLSRGTLVVEAALRSGSLITARLANEAGRDVFAIPGSICSPQSRGCHALIKQGAQLVESVDDVFESWQLPLRSAGSMPVARPAVQVSPDAELQAALGHDPVDFDTLVARTGLETPVLQERLLLLELAGRVARLPGQLFQQVVAPGAEDPGV